MLVGVMLGVKYSKVVYTSVMQCIVTIIVYANVRCTSLEFLVVIPPLFTRGGQTKVGIRTSIFPPLKIINRAPGSGEGVAKQGELRQGIPVIGLSGCHEPRVDVRACGRGATGTACWRPWSGRCRCVPPQ